ncbi:MAG: hypothetical protein ACF8MJ_12575 [Phycisphaerales bacterium JB050]
MIKTTTARFFLCATVCVASVVALHTSAEAQTRRGDARQRQADPAQKSLDAAIREKLSSLLTPEGEPLAGQKFSSALQEVGKLMTDLVWYASSENTDLFREVTKAERMLRLMVDGRQTQNDAMWQMLIEHEELASSLAFGLQPGRDEFPEAMQVLEGLRQQFGADKLAQYPDLTAAICAVHDSPRYPPGRNPTKAATPNELWAYFVRYEDRMAMGIRGMPIDLLAHLVDSTASIGEMQWALDRYGKDPQVGNRYSEISYDDNALNQGQKKRIDSEQYTLQNIRRVGGVCAEQAYFAAHVGKAMGVPSVEVSSIGQSMSHAWLGFLRVRGRQAAWDFDSGRYDEYKKYVGDFRDPLSGRKYSEGHVAFLSQMVGVKPDELHTAVAMHDAAALLATSREGSDAPPLSVRIEADASFGPVRTSDDAGISELLTAAFKATGTERRIWELAGRLAKEGRLAGKELEAIFGYLEKLCGRNESSYFAMIAPTLLWAIEDVRQQARMFDRVARTVRNVPGQEAEVRFLQGDGLRDREMYQEAMAAYLLPTKYRNLDGPWTIKAIDRVTDLLNRTGKQAHLPDLLEDIFRRVPRPSTEGSVAMRRGSVWAQVGERYYNSLVQAGRTRDAEQLRRQLDTIVIPRELPMDPRRR